MAATYEELMAKSREFASSGDMKNAKRVAQIALKRRDTAPQAPKADTSFMGRLKDNFVGVDDGVQSYGETAAAVLNKAGESMTMGLVGDEAAGKADELVGRGEYDERRDFYRQQEADLEANNPALALGAEIGGALAIPGGIVAGMAKAPAAASRVAKAANLGKRMAASGAATGALSGTYGFMEGEGGVDQRTEKAISDGALGAGIGTAIPLAGAGVQKVADALANRKAIQAAARGAPTTEQLRRQGQAAYQAIDDMGVSVKPEAFKRASDGISAQMVDGGLDQLPGPSSLTPKAARLNQIMGEMNGQMASEPTASLPFKSVEQLRRKAGGVARQADPTEAALGARAIGGLDDFMGGLSKADVDAGDAEAIGPAIEKARDVWARMSRSQTIDDAIEAGDNYLSGGSSGIRNQFRRILASEKLNRGFSDAEKKAMRRVVNGSIPEQALNLLGGGLGQLASIGAGAGIGGWGGAIAGAGIGAAARKGSEMVSRKNAEVVRAIIANGGMKAPALADPSRRKIAEQLMRRAISAQ